LGEYLFSSCLVAIVAVACRVRPVLDRERMAVELIFRDRDEQGEWLYVVSIQGEGGEGLDTSPHAIDRDHAEFSRRCKEPGWLEAEPQLLLLPEPVRRAVVQWATGGSSVTD
jgi:hypothetical protein